MTTELKNNNTLSIEAYSFSEFLQEFQQAVLDGYSLDLETNEHFPQKFGSHLTVTLVSDQWKIDKETPEKVETVEETPVVAAKPAGRPRKAATAG